MTDNPLAYRRSWWLQQPSDTVEARGAMDGFDWFGRMCDTVVANGGKGDGIVLKVMDGLTWMGHVKGEPLHPAAGIASVLRCQTIAVSKGLEFAPVVNVRGLRGEAESHGAMFAAIGTGWCDLEPYAGFWDQAPLSEIPAYTGALRSSSAGAHLVLQPDPRGQALDAIAFEDIADDFDSVAAQYYVGWSSIGWLSVPDTIAMYDRIDKTHCPQIPTLYGTDRVDLAAEFWNELTRGRDPVGFNVFKLGIVGPREFSVFSALQAPPKPLPPPPTPPPPVPAPEDLDTWIKHELGYLIDIYTDPAWHVADVHVQVRGRCKAIYDHLVSGKEGTS